ncbi:hypothetical protein U1Q18_038566 [Sarracenia purpurea var. burkii]
MGGHGVPDFNVRHSHTVCATIFVKTSPVEYHATPAAHGGSARPLAPFHLRTRPSSHFIPICEKARSKP